jgi:K+-transporting ATPase KdpF subunit
LTAFFILHALESQAALFPVEPAPQKASSFSTTACELRCLLQQRPGIVAHRHDRAMVPDQSKLLISQGVGHIRTCPYGILTAPGVGCRDHEVRYGRSICGDCGWTRCRERVAHRGLRAAGETRMTWVNWLGTLLAIGIFVYLLVALFKPEKF